MEQCLQIPEILRYVCDELDTESCLSAALTSRTFLEPALDRLWYYIDSMRPLICCLPEGAGIVKRDKVPKPGMYLYPDTAFKREHLDRYLSFYAHRIRFFTSPTFKPRQPCLSTEFLLALQIATDYEHGALAPLLRKVTWSSPCWTDVQSRATLSAFVCLFVGKHTESFKFQANEKDQEALYNASLLSNIKRVSKRLKNLTIEGRHEANFVHPFLIPFSWDSLEVLKVSVCSSTLIQCLATLPRLHTLEICDKNLDKSTLHAIPKPTTPPRPTDFVHLRTLNLGTFSDAVDRVWAMLEHLPLTNQLQQFGMSSSCIGESAICQGIIDAIAFYCNPQTLTSIRLLDWDVSFEKVQPNMNELDEADQEDPLDISPLYPFNQLEVLVVSWFPDVRLSAQDATTIPRSWPRLRHLNLCSPYGLDGRVPSLSHTHLLDIATGCPDLTYLGLRLDTSQLTGEEQLPLATPHRRLRTLRVSNSPISSPSRVLAFFKSHFPRLEELDVSYADYDPEALSVLDRRWAAVLEGL